MGTTTSLEDLPNVLTVKAVKGFLGIGLNQTYDLIRQGQIRSRRVGTRYLVPREALREYLAGSDAWRGAG